MTAIPPSWAMGALGLDGTGDSHLQPGIHLRVFTSPQMGLPTRPFVVYRLEGDHAQRRLAGLTRTTFIWRDAQGRILQPPFAVMPGHPVTGHIVRPAAARAMAVGVVTGADLPSLVARPLGGLARKGLRVQAFIDTPQGRRILGERRQSPYVLAASDIHGVVLDGQGIVRSGWWIEADVSLVDKLKPAFLMDLPVPGGSRYQGLPDAVVRAEKRVRRGAPLRFGLHDDPNVATPAAAAPATDHDEWARVEPLAQDLSKLVDQVVNDLSQPLHALTHIEPLTDGVSVKAQPASTAVLKSLRTVLSATADPGLARWLGYAELDTEPAALAGPMTLYFIRGFVTADLKRMGLIHRLQLAQSGGLMKDGRGASGSVPFGVEPVSKDGEPVFDFTVPVLVFPGAPPVSPGAPDVGEPVPPSQLVGPLGSSPPATDDGQGPWLAEFVPPEARREVVLPLSRLGAAPTLAAARQDASGLVSLNSRHPVSKRAVALVPAVPEAALDTGTGRLADRGAPEGVLRYRVAQADWFGRWSGWRERDVPAKARPLPPEPAFHAHYDLAADTPVDDAPRFGRFFVQVSVPRPDDLAPGSRLLVSARASGTIAGVPFSVSRPVSAAVGKFLQIEVPAPAGQIGRAQRVEAEVTVQWHDGVQEGPAAPVQRKTLVDPRPPAALVMDPTLRYTARPDAVGRARIVLEWPAAAGVRYRVYTTDETRLKAALGGITDGRQATAQALLADVAAAPSAAHRAAAYTQPARKALFERGFFTNLTDTPLGLAGGGPLRFSHDLSGSLKVLSFFKVVALSADNVESPFTDAALLPVGVPSGGPPPRPLLDFLGWTDEGAARLKVTAVRGAQPAVRWRLRRSFAESADALRMPVVAQGVIPSMAPDADGPNVFEIVDAGAELLPEPGLRPWTRTAWRVEVQTGSPPGSTLPGEWSEASGAVGSLRMPDPPAAPADVAVDSLSGDRATLRWTHPDALRKGAMGGYRFDVYRQMPGERPARIGTVLADDPSAVTGAGASRTFRFAEPTDSASGARWQIVTLDPAGRMGPPSDAVIRS